MARISTDQTKRIAHGISGLELFRLMPEFRRHTLETFTELTKRFGHIVRHQGLWISHTLTHPSYIEHVLQHNAQNYLKGRSYRVMKESTGNGLFVSEGEFWRRQRRLAQPAFHRSRIQSFAQTMVEAIEAMLRTWHFYAQQNKSIEVSAEMRALTLRIAGLTLFSTDLSEETDAMGRMVTKAQEFAIKRMFQILRLPLALPTPDNLRYRQLLREGDRAVYNIIDERRRGAKPEARDEETGEVMSDLQLRDEVFTLLIAGHETTAVTLAWTWYLLAQHPEVEHKLHAELSAMLGRRIATVEDLPKLKHTLMVIEEAMRLYPPAWALGRTAIADDVIDGYHIPARSEILIFPYITHRHADFWDEPETFNPERFAPENAQNGPRYAYFPFGGGPRQCIGNNFALMEAQLVLATVAQGYQLRLASDQRIELDASVTLRPRRGMTMTLQKRNAEG